ncbi:hypothetical protein RRG08_054443 [Elysia crispata]|uniref:Uncharacterized protein n=1 Tax=Elysia crispata TaxID=231223 RepID=A0AAE1E566_9GAST|nr:hypothetical protein RRG08_054443 [Elysia crispata]
MHNGQTIGVKLLTSPTPALYSHGQVNRLGQRVSKICSVYYPSECPRGWNRRVREVTQLASGGLEDETVDEGDEEADVVNRSAEGGLWTDYAVTPLHLTHDGQACRFLPHWCLGRPLHGAMRPRNRRAPPGHAGIDFHHSNHREGRRRVLDHTALVLAKPPPSTSGFSSLLNIWLGVTSSQWLQTEHSGNECSPRVAFPTAHVNTGHPNRIRNIWGFLKGEQLAIDELRKQDCYSFLPKKHPFLTLAVSRCCPSHSLGVDVPDVQDAASHFQILTENLGRNWYQSGLVCPPVVQGTRSTVLLATLYRGLGVLVLGRPALGPDMGAGLYISREMSLADLELEVADPSLVWLRPGERQERMVRSG